MPPEVLDLLRRFQGGDGVEPLTDEELAALRTGLEAAAGELYEAGTPTAETVQELTDLADAVEAVDAALVERGEAAAVLQAAVEDAITRIRAHEENRSVQEQPEGQPAGETAVEPPAAEASADETPEARQAAAIRRASEMAARRPATAAPRRSPDHGPARATAVLTSATHWNSGNVSLNAGDAIPNERVLYDMMARRLNAMGPHGGTSLIASQFTTYPEDRQLDPDDVARNEERMRAVSTPGAILASGGICTPVAVDYSIPTFSVADRPVKAALPAFGASRGGIRYLQPPLMSATANAVGVWTHANDANPTAPTTKALLKIACASELEVIVDAVTLRLEFGNLMARFSPEVVGANTELAMATFARVSDLSLLKQIVAGSTEVTFAGAGLGATPELLAVFDQALAGMKYVNRLSDSTMLRAILPTWVKPLVRSDLARRMATDNSEGSGGALNVSDAQIMQWFSNRNINVSWTLDALPAQGTGVTYTLQGFATQAAGALADYPAKLVFPIYPEGTWQFLDGGQLDLGVVRDSSLDATNDYETFFETFEGVANRGIVSYKVIVPLRPTGATAALVDTHTY